MDFWKAVLALARRKFVILPVLGLAIVAGLAGYSLTPLHYVSSATMVLAQPAFGRTLSLNPAEQEYLTNPMLSFGNDLKTASTILIFAVNAPDAAAELGAAEAVQRSSPSTTAGRIPNSSTATAHSYTSSAKARLGPKREMSSSGLSSECARSCSTARSRWVRRPKPT